MRVRAAEFEGQKSCDSHAEPQSPSLLCTLQVRLASRHRIGAEANLLFRYMKPRGWAGVQMLRRKMLRSEAPVQDGDAYYAMPAWATRFTGPNDMKLPVSPSVGARRFVTHQIQGVEFGVCTSLNRFWRL